MINLQQLYNLGLADHIDIFSGLTVPAECQKLDVDILKSACFERCGLSIPVYPDPDTMRAAITLWSHKNQYTFIHVDKIMQSEYSPIENVFEDTDVLRKFDGKTINDTTDKTTRDLKDELKNDKTDLKHGKKTDLTHGLKTELEHGKKVTESGSDDNNTTNTISAYDSSGYQPDNKSENKITYGHVATDSGKDTSTNSGKDTTENSGTDTTTRNFQKFYTGTDTKNIDGNETKDDTEHTITNRHGNIGITSANKLQIEEYNMLASFNPYNFLAGLFENELTLFVY